MQRMNTVTALATLALLAAAVACGEQRTPAPPGASPLARTSPQGSQPGAGGDVPGSAAPGSAAADAGPPPYQGPYVGATVLQASINSEMEWPAKEGRRTDDTKDRGTRLGYLRNGEKAPVIAEPHPKPNCPEGWYELVAGGYVCGKYVTLDLNHPRFKLARAPDLAGPLPYTYGVNSTHGAP